MSSVRFFSGGRDTDGKRSVASEIMRLEVQKNGKLPSQERFRMIFKKRLQESRMKAMGGKSTGFNVPKNIKEARQMSKKAEQALKEIAAKKAAKEAKVLRRMVIIDKRNFTNGRIDGKGKIFDIEGNMIGAVNKKNGKMATNQGWNFGKYKPKKMKTHRLITDTIDQFSPYYIRLRKLQQLQQAGGHEYGVWGDQHSHTPQPEVLNLYGRTASYDRSSGSGSPYGAREEIQAAGTTFQDMGPRQNVGVTAWGAMSDNVWGTYSDNAWGTSSDTVWGTNTSDVWGGIGGNPFGNFSRTVRIFGTGNGKNYLKAITNRIAGLFGISFKSKSSRAALRESVRQSRSSRSSGPSRSGGGPVTSRAPVATRSSAPVVGRR